MDKTLVRRTAKEGFSKTYNFCFHGLNMHNLNMQQCVVGVEIEKYNITPEHKQRFEKLKITDLTDARQAMADMIR